MEKKAILVIFFMSPRRMKAVSLQPSVMLFTDSIMAASNTYSTQFWSPFQSATVSIPPQLALLIRTCPVAPASLYNSILEPTLTPNFMRSAFMMRKRPQSSHVKLYGYLMAL